MAGYTEREAGGQVVLELDDSAPGVLWLLGIILLVWAVASLSAAAIMGGVLVFVVIVFLYVMTRNRMRVVIDAPRGMILVNARKLPMTEVTRAQLNSQYVAGRGAMTSIDKAEVHRVDLVLRSGEVLPLSKGFGQFSLEDCHRAIKRINAALGVR